MEKLKQDLHIHTTYSTGDSAVAQEQTPELVASLGHAEIRGISDHFEYLGEVFDQYERHIRGLGFLVGTEVNDSRDALKAVELPFDYYIYHCRNFDSEYQGAARLLETGKPVILSHPKFMGCDLSKVPQGCYIEINNRYIWRHENYFDYFGPFLDKFSFVLGSDAHKPNWLNHLCAEKAAFDMGIENTILFSTVVTS